MLFDRVEVVKEEKARVGEVEPSRIVEGVGGRPCLDGIRRSRTIFDLDESA